MVVYSQGRIVREGFWYQDQLKEDGDWFSYRKFISHIKDSYNLSDREYYNIVVFGDKDHKEYCNWCGKEVPFKSIRLGYQKYCNQSCTTNHTLKVMNDNHTNPFYNRDWIESNRIKVSEFQKERMRSGKHHFCKEDNELVASKNRYLRYGYETTRFYICETSIPGMMKFGISKWPGRRTTYKNGTKLFNHQEFDEAPCEIMVEIEYELKKEFCSNNSELFDSEKYDQVVQRYKELFNSSTTISLKESTQEVEI